MRLRKYNRMYTASRFALQILLLSTSQGIAIALLPAVDICLNGELLAVGISLQWLFGQVNFGIMQSSFVEDEKQRKKTVEANAQRLGLTVKQYTLRHL